jgi:lipopolysaccharide transport system permease protein
MSTVSDLANEVKPIIHFAPPTAGSRSPASSAMTFVERKPGWQIIDLRQLWRYRELLYFLTLRDIKVRYKQTVLGAAWAVLQPLATMLIFSLFFGRVAASTTSAVPYSLFVLSGLVPWMFFSTAIATSSQSVVASQNLVTKIYFPRLLIPMGAVGAALVDFAIAFVMLLAMMTWNGVGLGWSALLVFPVMLGLVVAAMGVGALLSALTVSYRDFRHVVPFLVQFWMFATPSIYLQQEVAIGRGSRLLLLANPAHGLIANLRAALMGSPLDYLTLSVSSMVAVGLLLLGCFYFRQMEGSFADVI